MARSRRWTRYDADGWGHGIAQLYRKQAVRAIERLTELSRLEQDWDTYGALPPSPDALDASRSFMTDVVERFAEAAAGRVVPYSIMPIADGGVQLEWRGPTADLELNVGPDRAISFLLIERHTSGRRFSEGSDLPRSEALDLVGRVLDP